MGVSKQRLLFVLRIGYLHNGRKISAAWVVYVVRLDIIEGKSNYGDFLKYLVRGGGYGY